jgi:hypothetical protein
MRYRVVNKFEYDMASIIYILSRAIKVPVGYDAPLVVDYMHIHCIQRPGYFDSFSQLIYMMDAIAYSNLLTTL